MIDVVTLLAFLPAALALNLTPGADMLYCLAQGAKGGAGSAWAAAAGISTGSIIHAALAGLGLGAAIAAQPWMFEVIRWVGVVYLVWIAIRTLTDTTPNSGASATAHAFRTGLLINLTNPKVILFILAFIPQFVDPGRPILPQFVVFGGILAIGGFVVNGCVGCASGGFGARLSTKPILAKWMRRATATLIGGLALRLALETRS